MKKNLTELVFILDKSGSMSGMESDTVGGFNSLIKKQKNEEGECLVSTVLFNHESSVLHDRVSIDEISDMTERDFTVGGCTALIDALGGAIHHIGNIHKYIRQEDVPEHTIFIIMTDGMENASRNYSSDDVKRMIEHEKSKYGWEFMFLGANIDAVETAKLYGIDEDRAVDYRCDSVGTAISYDAVGDAVVNMRCSKKVTRSWKKNIENDMKNRR